MNRKEALEAVKECSFGVLSMVNIRSEHPLGVGAPYAIPLNIVLCGEIVYFHCAREGHKLDNLRADPRVILSCTSYEKVISEKLTTVYDTALVFGNAREVTDEKERRIAIDELVRKYAPAELGRMDDIMEKSGHIMGIWAIDIVDVSGKRRQMPGSQEAQSV
ncbi:pyridoxamine 5'-phosphate oxidase family protein [Parasphaerochaeta coccoides]|nr:pyridoxamine 5'-phosphate oxidase family protein [Parasphaerochaeta coccoides]